MSIKVGCTGKMVFVCFTKAAERAKALNRREEDAHVEAYHCRCCNAFHVGGARAYGKEDARKEARRVIVQEI